MGKLSVDKKKNESEQMFKNRKYFPVRLLNLNPNLR